MPRRFRCKLAVACVANVGLAFVIARAAFVGEQHHLSSCHLAGPNELNGWSVVAIYEGKTEPAPSDIGMRRRLHALDRLLRHRSTDDFLLRLPSVVLRIPVGGPNPEDEVSYSDYTFACMLDDGRRFRLQRVSISTRAQQDGAF